MSNAVDLRILGPLAQISLRAAGQAITTTINEGYKERVSHASIDRGYVGPCPAVSARCHSSVGQRRHAGATCGAVLASSKVHSRIAGSSRIGEQLRPAEVT